MSRGRTVVTGVSAFVLAAVLCLAILELGARAFWSVRYGVPFLEPDRIGLSHYPGLGDVRSLPASREDEVFDVLLLGGSVLHRFWGDVQDQLGGQLSATRGRVRIVNLARAAHNSLDSLTKYRLLADARFDLVLVYHGINEVRVNNVPPDVFRSDYGHNPWYEAVGVLAPYHGEAVLALPYTARFLWMRVRQRWHPDRYLAEPPRDAWQAYGGTLSSVEPFEANLEAIVALAAERGDPLVLVTFALHLADDYTLEAFRAKQLDYGLHRDPIELWGRPEHVRAAVAAQNERVRRIAARHPGVVLVDLERTLPRGAAHFDDVCHLTAAGSEAFARAVVAALPP